MEAINPNGFLGYVIVAGSSVTTTTVDTTKGTFDVTQGTENWYTASAQTVNVSNVDSVTWSVQTFDTQDSSWRDDLEQAIDDADGLATSSSNINTVATAPSGPVLWDTGGPGSGYSIFEMTDTAGDHYWLNLKQSRGNHLSEIAWSTDNDGNLDTTPERLPSEFASGTVDLDGVSSASGVRFHYDT